MLNVEKDLWEAIENGLGEETQKEIAELEQFDSEIMYNGIIENLGDDAYADGVIATLVAIQKERSEIRAKKSKESTFLIVGGVLLMGYATCKIVSGIRNVVKKCRNNKKEVQND